MRLLHAVRLLLLSGRRPVRPHRRATALRDESLRAGVAVELDPRQAALRAQGRNAWMRPGGFS